MLRNHMKPYSRLSLLNAAGIVLLICFTALILRNSADVSMGYDDSYNATVAKNLAQGLGYASSYETMKPFDPQVTTGPTLLLPTALVIKLFGNTPWAPSMTTAVIVLAMLAVVLLVASRRMQVSFGLLALCSIPPIAIVTQLVDGWSRLRGDILAAELIALATLLLPFGSEAADRRSVRHVLLAGVIFGMAILTKLLAVLCIAAIVVVWVADMMLQADRGYRAWRVLMVLAAGTLIPIALLEIARFISLHGLTGYLGNLRATFITNANQESFVTGKVQLWARLKQTPFAGHLWLNYVGMSRHSLISWLLFLGWSGMATAGLFQATRAARCRLLALAIAGAGLMFCFFTLFNAITTPRVQLPAMLLALAVGMATAEWMRQPDTDASRMESARAHRQRLMGVPLGLVAAFALFWVASFSADARPEWQQARASVSAARAQILSTREREPNATFCGLGWSVPFVLEYSLPGAQWFRNCEGRMDALTRVPDSAIYLVLESKIANFLLTLTPTPDYGLCHGTVVHKDEGFEMQRCSVGPQTASLPQTP